LRSTRSTRSAHSKRGLGLDPSEVLIAVVVLAVSVVALVRRVVHGAEQRWGALPGTARGATLAAVVALAAGAALAVGRFAFGRRRAPGGPARPSRGAGGAGREGREVGFAETRELRRLVVSQPPGDRIVIGRHGRKLLAAEQLQSLLVVGPSQSGKTTGLAIPTLVEWAGPVLATSVKADLLRETHEVRSRLGPVAVFDPTRSTGIEGAGWSPLSAATTWPGARRVAEALCSLGRREGIDDAGFWYASAERLLAPLLLAAALSSRSMSDVVAWLDDQEIDTAVLVLELAGEREAARTATSCAALEERQRSSVISTAQSVLGAYADPDVAASETGAPRIDSGWLLEGTRTLYCSAPARDQSRLSPVFVSLVREVIDAAFERSTKLGRPLDPPLLVLLDEAANIAPLPDLDRVLATAAGHGVVIVSVWQDLAQVEARYGARWATVVNNHRAKVVFPGIADPRTLELLSSLIGDAETRERSLSRSKDGGWSETDSPGRLAVAPAGWIRRLPDGHGLLVYGSLPPALVQLRLGEGVAGGLRGPRS
jgi:type IV secretion system protein VirD4